MSTDSSLTTPTNIVSPRPQLPLFSTSTSYFLPPTPPPATPPGTRTSPKRPSISAAAAMNWLSHKSSNSIASFTSLRTRSNSLNKDQSPALQGLRISEPIPLGEEPGSAMHPRPRHHHHPAPTRPLGAEVVATPAEALERPVAGGIASPPPTTPNNTAGRRPGDLPPIPQSPPSAGGVAGLRSSKSSPHLKSPTFHHHSRTTSEYSGNSLRSPPPVRSSFRGGPSGHGVVVPPLTPFPTPPAQPLNIPSEAGSVQVPPVAPQPKFNAVLLSSNVDFKLSASRKSQVIVTLETSTEVFKTSLSTLTSRPSYAATWFESVAKGGEEPIEEEGEDMEEPASTTSSVPPSPFTRAFQDHLTSQGLRPSVPSYREIHLFMDRPSAPYPHILNYLRSPVESTSLPRAVQLWDQPSPKSTYDAMKVDALFELRDEAAYLGLEGLLQLCEIELKKWFLASRRHSAHHKPTQSTSTTATSRPTSSESPRTSAVVPPTTTAAAAAATTAPTSTVLPPPRPLRRAASHRILSPSVVPESINEDDVMHSDGDVHHPAAAAAAPWSEFGVARPSSMSEDGSSGVYDSSANEDSATSGGTSAATTTATVTLHTGLPPRPTSPETITRATAAAVTGGHLRSRSSSAIPLGFSTSSHFPTPNRPLPDVPSSTSSSALSTPTNAPAPLAPSVGLGLRTRNKTRSRSNSRSEGVVRPTIIPPAAISTSGASRGGNDRHQRGNSFLPSLMSPSTPKTAGSSSANWI